MQYTQPALFPITDIQVDGYAEPEPRQDGTVMVDDEMPEAA
ncbi:hypothetical protein [Streptomyces sp. WAC01280]|nr:hypothetical protein [Streptomyces sp. WAC01280]